MYFQLPNCHVVNVKFHNENQILAHFMKFLHTSVEDAICVFSAEIVNTFRVLESILQKTIQSYFVF